MKEDEKEYLDFIASWPAGYKFLIALRVLIESFFEPSFGYINREEPGEQLLWHLHIGVNLGLRLVP